MTDNVANRYGSEGSHDWYTPESVLRIVHATFPADVGGFLDPCSSREAQARVGAAQWSDCAIGPGIQWPDLPAFCNPPGGKSRHTQTAHAQCLQHVARTHKPVLFLSFSADTIQTCRLLEPVNVTYVPRRRLSYFDPRLGREHGSMRPSMLTLYDSFSAIGRSETRARFAAACELHLPGGYFTSKVL